MSAEIPEDIRATAQSLIDNYGFDPEGLLCGAIKAALVFERERCARLAEEYPETVLHFYPRPGSPPGNMSRPASRADIAAAIRGKP